MTFDRIDIDLPEIQGDPKEIVKEKLAHALKVGKVSGPIIIEDTSLGYDAFNGLPGPYIKFFLKSLKNQGLYNMLKGFDDKSAKALCIFGLAKPGKKIDTEDFLYFSGETEGKIVEPRGPEKFGWDPIFEPIGFDQTFAEMDSEVKNSISHRRRALNTLAEYLNENPEYLES